MHGLEFFISIFDYSLLSNVKHLLMFLYSVWLSLSNIIPAYSEFCLSADNVQTLVDGRMSKLQKVKQFFFPTKFKFICNEQTICNNNFDFSARHVIFAQFET